MECLGTDFIVKRLSTDAFLPFESIAGIIALYPCSDYCVYTIALLDYDVGMQQVVDITPGGNVVILHIDLAAERRYTISLIDPRMFASYNIPVPSICDAHLGLLMFASA
mgnify:CR=1 FL=1